MMLLYCPLATVLLVISWQQEMVAARPPKCKTLQGRLPGVKNSCNDLWLLCQTQLASRCRRGIGTAARQGSWKGGTTPAGWMSTLSQASPLT